MSAGSAVHAGRRVNCCKDKGIAFCALCRSYELGCVQPAMLRQAIQIAQENPWCRPPRGCNHDVNAVDVALSMRSRLYSAPTTVT
jgi:hypothetical protein